MAPDAVTETTSTVDFRMPSLGSDMDSGIVLRWRVEEGDQVHKGDILLDVDTEKSEIEVEVWQDAVVAQILVQPGAEVAVGTPLAQLGVGLQSGPRTTEPSTAEAAASVVIDPAPQPVAVPPSPVVVDHGPSTALPSPRMVYWPTATPSPGTGDGPATREPLSRPARRQAVVASLMERSIREIPHFHLTSEIDLGNTLAWLEAANDAAAPPERILPAAVLLRATALAATIHPGFNGTWTDGTFTGSEHVHMGVAVHIRGGGLMTPVLANADSMDLVTVMAELRGVVGRARAGRLRSTDTTSSTLTVTNLGDSGGDMVLGIIQPPQVALIGFGRISNRPFVVADQVVPRPTVMATLSADHRANNGQTGAAFLATLAELLASPEEL